MSITTSGIPGGIDDHFHRNMEPINDSQAQNMKNNNFSRGERTQLHKKRKGTNGFYPNQPFNGVIQQDNRVPPTIYIKQPPNDFSIQNNFNPQLDPNFQHRPTPHNYPQGIAFGSLGSQANNFSVPNLSLNENMFSSFTLPSSLHPTGLPQASPMQHISPLGVDIGSLPNLTGLAPQSFINEASHNTHVQQQQQQQFNPRQAVLEQLKVQELQQQQQLLKMFPATSTVKKEGIRDSQENILLSQQQQEKRPNHHDILRQHNEEYKMKQMKKAAVHQASTRYGHYAPQDSSHFNFILPVLPTYLVEGMENTQEGVMVKEENAL
jgi:hypothetical protein